MEKEREGSSSSETNPPEEERDESMVIWFLKKLNEILI